MNHEEAWPRGATPHPRSGAATDTARLQQSRSGREEIPHVEGAASAWAQEGQKELLHVQGQEGQP